MNKEEFFTMNPYVINTDAFQVNEEQFFYFCAKNRDLRIERDKNQNILIMAPLGGIGGYYEAGVNAQVTNWNQKTKLGYVFSPSTGFTLPNGAMRSPDVAWIQKARWDKVPLHDKEKFAHICPDFVIEIRSKSDPLVMLKEKMIEWMQNGCRLGWLIDPEEKKVYIYLKGKKGVRCVKFGNPVTGGDVLPGFILDVSALK